MRCLVAKLFLILYLLAVFLFMVGHFGWFGQARDPLSGVFLIPLGAPWNFVFSRMPIEAPLLVGLLSPLLNLALIISLCKYLRER